MNSEQKLMLEQVVQSFDRKDYKAALQHLKQLWQEIPESPMVQLYRAKLYEVADKFEQAETIYRHLLRDVTNPKVALQARQGLQRLQDSEKSQRQAAIVKAKVAASTSDETGILVLEAIPTTARPAAAQHMAKVMQLDAYTARMQIPNRGWKLYRSGQLGELQFHEAQIRSGNIPAFCVSTAKIKAIPVFHVESFQEFAPQATVICKDPSGQRGELEFDWQEVTQRVDGALPIFENVVDTDILREGTRRLKKEETLDYIRVCDLHLPQRNCILRFSDRSYDFQSGLAMADDGLDQLNTRIQWNSLMQFLTTQMPQIPIWADFTHFADGAMDSAFLIEQFDSHLRFYDLTKPIWASAFHLYSGLAFWRDRG
jgi:hypothetical protein